MPIIQARPPPIRETMRTLIKTSNRKGRRWTFTGMGMLCLPLAAQAANDSGWQACVQAAEGATAQVAPDGGGASMYADAMVQVNQPLHANPPAEAYTVRGADMPRGLTSPSRYKQEDAATLALVDTPSALFAYGAQLTDGLHQRLGEVRNVMPTSDVGGDLFVRYAGHGYNLHDRQHSSEARQKADTLQIGGAVAFWNDEGTSHRLGWALDKGSVSVTPKRRTTRANYDATGLSAWYTLQHDGGAYLDAVIGRSTFDGRFSNDASHGLKLKASQWVASVETGVPVPASENVTIEPQAQLKFQSLHTSSISGSDGQFVRAGRSHQTTARVGVRLAKIDNERFVPYVRVDLERRFGEAGKRVAIPGADGGSKQIDATRAGASYGISAGMTIKVNRVVDFYADAKAQQRFGGKGPSGWAANAGVRVSF